MKNDEPQTPRAKLETLLRWHIGRECISSSGRESSLLLLLDIIAEDKGWRAKFRKENGEESTIGQFQWDWQSNDFPYSIYREYWHFPYLSERYEFDARMVQNYRETTAPLKAVMAHLHDLPIRLLGMTNLVYDPNKNFLESLCPGFDELAQQKKVVVKGLRLNVPAVDMSPKPLKPPKPPDPAKKPPRKKKAIVLDIEFKGELRIEIEFSYMIFPDEPPFNEYPQGLVVPCGANFIRWDKLDSVAGQK